MSSGTRNLSLFLCGNWRLCLIEAFDRSCDVCLCLRHLSIPSLLSSSSRKTLSQQIGATRGPIDRQAVCLKRASDSERVRVKERVKEIGKPSLSHPQSLMSSSLVSLSSGCR